MSTGKATLGISIVGALLLLLTLNSCNKGCNLPDSSNSTNIYEDAVIYPASGYLTTSMNGNYHITGSHSYADKFEIRLTPTGGKTNVNYSQYSILANPMNVSCEASFERSLTVIDSLGLAIYSVTAYQCANDKCGQTRTVENYVLVPAIPDSYIIQYDAKIVEQ